MVDADCAGQRIDNFLISRLKGLPKSRLYRLLRKGEVRVNKGRVKPDYRIAAGDRVRIPPVDLAASPAPVQLSSSLANVLARATLFEDEQWLVINKPEGLAVHGGSGQSVGLIEALRILRDDCRYLELCHRIDKDTSGCIVIAKKRSALKRFHSALREKKLTKKYAVLVTGNWPAGIDVVNAPLVKNVMQSGERMVFASVEGKPSKTLFSVQQKFAQYTLLEAQPVTGRTHQIRVHSKVAGFPIAGDRKYGNDTVNKQLRAVGYKQLFLHAQSISVPAEQGYINVRSELPDSWVSLLESLS